MKIFSIARFNKVLIAFIALACFVSCKQKTQEVIPSIEYATYVNAYTGGMISQSSSIRIELTQPQPVVDLNTEISGNPFTFSPSLKGKAYWVDNKTIEFMPEPGALKPGTLYNATFQLNEYATVDKGLEKFEFSFRVMERNFMLNIEALDVPASDPTQVSVRGEVRFSDVMDRELVEKMITARTEDKQAISVNLESSENTTKYAFVISGIKKGNKENTLRIDINGKTAGIDKTVEEKISIPAKDSFTFLSAQRITQPENGVQLTFSEPVSDMQDLNGLIHIPELNNYVFQVKDNKVNVYFESTRYGTITVGIDKSIQSITEEKLGSDSSVSFTQQASFPKVEMLSSGTIIPDSKNLIIPFRAVSLYAVDINIIRIFESNVLMFMQDNSLESSNELRRSGRLVYKKMLRLDTDPERDLTQWNDYTVDLTKLIQQEPGALYRVELSFKQEYSAYPCGNGEERRQFAESSNQLTKVGSGDMTEEDEAVWDVPNSYYSSYYTDVDWNVFDWSETNNPCHVSYYMYSSDKKASCTVLASNLGMIVKRNASNKIWAAITNILDTNPVAQADVTAYNFQLQPIGTAKTDADGFAVIETKGGQPFVVVASHNKQKTYLKVIDGEEKSTSRFDVGGKELQKGLKGFIYGERGVWRPGDTLYISFILEDQEKRIPDKHPVSLEVYNPRGQFYSKIISTNGLNGFYTFKVPTQPDDPTGLWNGYVKVGGTSFHKSFRIETVKPNRLKINLKLPGEYINASQGNVPVTLSSNWLTGANANGLKVKVEMSLSKASTQFPNYNQYIFNNPATEFSTSKTDVFDGVLDNQGNANFNLKVPEAKNAPGMLRANITTRVFEPGGDASINTTTIPFSPFASYVGVNLNQPKGKYIETDQDHVFDVVTVNADGKPVNRSNLEYRIYRVGWSWWWENRNDSFESYINNSSITPAASGQLQTVNGKAQFTFRVDYPSWGRYLVYVKDKDSNHATGGTIYIDWPDWRGRSNKTDPSGVTMLSFSTDKESYEIGETVSVFIPAAAEGRALVALENGSTVMKREWVKVSSEGDTKYQFKVTPDMAPNIYVHISLLQPHAQSVNDLPIRMYGVMPVFVTNKESILEPQIKMPDVLRPETEFTVAVSEKNGKPMTYTLAIVDDGLLDLTNFKTPDAWSEFYAREALGIRTWDMFDQVVGAYTGNYSSLFSVGGDEMLKGPDSRANRFRPVVKFIGPFTLEKGKTDTHKITLPMYVGSVRTMIVAGQNGAYGNAEKTTPVRTPLMLLSTLPRVLSIGEDILVPVNIFAMENDVKNVTVSIETSENLQLTDGNKKSVTFTEPGDQMLYFNLRAGTQTGKEVIHISASGNGNSTKETIEIDVRNPNPVITNYESKLLGAGESSDFAYRLNGNLSDSWIKLEVSRIPSVDISRRFDFLYNYEHYCTEQLTSRALPLLFVTQFKDVDEKEMESIKKNIQEAISNLYGRQLPNGGFVYWPGNADANEWITSYAGSFLIMAQEKGYEVNANVVNKWKAYQRRAAQNWTPVSREDNWYNWQSDLQQAYRLYTLALANAPELGAMNRMKEMKELSLQAKWRLAAAYALDGKANAANELVFNAQTSINPYSSGNYIYGSFERDEAMILETLVLLGKDREAFMQAQKVSKNLSRETYFSTQSTAFSLMAMGRLAEKLSGAIDMDWSLNGTQQPVVKSAKAIYQKDIPVSPASGNISVKNNGNGSLYVDLITRTQLVKDTLPAISNNLRLQVKYVDMNGRTINVSSLPQGTDFTAKVTVTNINGFTDYTNIALTHIIPAGWEIFNERMINPDEEVTEDTKASSTRTSKTDNTYTYRDIRDDRVLTYFDLKRNQEKTFDIRLQTTYAGIFVLPAIQCEAMYDTEVQARTTAGRVMVER